MCNQRAEPPVLKIDSADVVSIFPFLRRRTLFCGGRFLFSRLSALLLSCPQQPRLSYVYLSLSDFTISSQGCWSYRRGLFNYCFSTIAKWVPAIHVFWLLIMATKTAAKSKDGSSKGSPVSAKSASAVKSKPGSSSHSVTPPPSGKSIRAKPGADKQRIDEESAAKVGEPKCSAPRVVLEYLVTSFQGAHESSAHYARWVRIDVGWLQWARNLFRWRFIQVRSIAWPTLEFTFHASLHFRSTLQTHSSWHDVSDYGSLATRAELTTDKKQPQLKNSFHFLVERMYIWAQCVKSWYNWKNFAWKLIQDSLTKGVNTKYSRESSIICRKNGSFACFGKGVEASVSASSVVFRTWHDDQLLRGATRPSTILQGPAHRTLLAFQRMVMTLKFLSFGEISSAICMP